MAKKLNTSSKPGRYPHFIREWRKYRKLTQEELAEMVGLSNGAISQLETGRINYTQGTLEDIADALGCTAGDLLSRDPNKDDWKKAALSKGFELLPMDDLDDSDIPELSDNIGSLVRNKIRHTDHKK